MTYIVGLHLHLQGSLNLECGSSSYKFSIRTRKECLSRDLTTSIRDFMAAALALPLLTMGCVQRLALVMGTRVVYLHLLQIFFFLSALETVAHSVLTSRFKKRRVIVARLLLSVSCRNQQNLNGQHQKDDVERIQREISMPILNLERVTMT